MRTMSLDVYSLDSNTAVIKVPGRKFPGSLIQGDSLSILVSLAKSVADRVSHLSGGEGLKSDTTELFELLNERILHYETVLGEHGIELPYSKK